MSDDSIEEQEDLTPRTKLRMIIKKNEKYDILFEVKDKYKKRDLIFMRQMLNE